MQGAPLLWGAAVRQRGGHVRIDGPSVGRERDKNTISAGNNPNTAVSYSDNQSTSKQLSLEVQ